MSDDLEDTGVRAAVGRSEPPALGLARIDGEGRVLWSNAGWRALGRPAAGPWAAGLDLTAAAAARLGRGPAGEAVVCAAEGRWLRLTLEVCGADEAMVTAVDVTAERRELAAVAAREARWRQALEGSGLGVWDWDVETGRVYFSSAWKRMLGYADDEVGETLDEWSSRVHPDDLGATIAIVERHLRGETEEYASEHRMRHKDGRWVWILDRGRVCARGPDGAARWAVGTHMDISGRVDLRARLRESEERFRSAFEAAGVGMALVSLVGRFLAVNPSFCEILGYAEAELLACDFQSLTHPDDLAADLELAGQLLRGERRSYQLEKRYLCRGGRVAWVLLTGSVVRDADGRPQYFIAQVEDVTARKQAEAELSASEARYRALVEAADDAIAAFDPEGRFLYANAAAAAIMGAAPAALIGRALTELLPPERAAQRMHDLQAALRRGRTVEFEREFQAANGVRVMQTKLIPVRDASGAWTKVISLGRDVTEQRRLAAERQALAERAEKAQRLESLGVMAGGVAHDLNNMLAVMLAHADCARVEAPANSDIADSLDQIADAARRAAELTAQLNAVAGKPARGREPVALAGLVRDTVALLRPKIPRSCAVRLELAPATVLADPGQLRQIVLNLVINAVQALEARGGAITVRTGVRAVDDTELRGTAGTYDLAGGTYAYLAVADDGPGMTEEVQRRVFEPFFSTKGSGRGLGLAVVHGVARGHRGGVLLTSAPERGTAIEVLLPPEARAASEVDEAAPGEPVQRQGVVLVVDDERAIRDSLRRSLRLLGFEVYAFESGQGALGFVRSEPDAFVLVVLDLLMPDMDGLEVLRELWRARPDAQVVISSGSAGPLALDDVPVGARVRFLSKPYGLAELQALLRDLLG